MGYMSAKDGRRQLKGISMPHNQGGDARRQPSDLRDGWAAWTRVSCPAARDQLLHHYFSELVEPIARAQHRQLPPSVELGDLEQAGYLGLHDAWHRFDNRVCDDFRPYAKQRIRGSIHDWLRREDLLSRGARADVRKVQTTADQFRTRYGFEPEEEVLGRLTGLRPDRVFHVQTWSTRGAAVAVSVIAANEPEPEGCLPPAESCSEARSELLDWLECTFDVRTRTMVALYYGESLSMAQTAQVLGLSESRVSQLLGELHRQLRATLRTPSRFVELFL